MSCDIPNSMASDPPVYVPSSDLPLLDPPSLDLQSLDPPPYIPLQTYATLNSVDRNWLESRVKIQKDTNKLKHAVKKLLVVVKKVQDKKVIDDANERQVIAHVRHTINILQNANARRAESLVDEEESKQACCYVGLVAILIIVVLSGILYLIDKA